MAPAQGLKMRLGTFLWELTPIAGSQIITSWVSCWYHPIQSAICPIIPSFSDRLGVETMTLNYLLSLSLVSHEEVYGKVNSTCVADDKQSARILHINPMDYGLTFYIRPNERGTPMAHKLLSVNYSHIIVLDMSQSEKMCDVCQYPNWSRSRSRRH